MDMDQAAIFLAGSILTALGFVVIVAAVVAVNNIIHRYWKPVRIFTSDSFNISPGGNVRFAEPHELDKSQEPKVK
jgi:hypothetical protein